MIDDEGVEWVDLGNGNAYCTELKDGMVAMLNGGSLVLMTVEAFEAMERSVTATVSPAQPIGADHD